MQELNFEEFTKEVLEKKKDIDRKLLSLFNDKNINRRPRDLEEIEILDKITINRWLMAEETGKIKYLGKREIFYGFD